MKIALIVALVRVDVGQRDSAIPPPSSYAGWAHPVTGDPDHRIRHTAPSAPSA